MHFKCAEATEMDRDVSPELLGTSVFFDTGAGVETGVAVGAMLGGGLEVSNIIDTVSICISDAGCLGCFSGGLSKLNIVLTL